MCACACTAEGTSSGDKICTSPLWRGLCFQAGWQPGKSIQSSRTMTSLGKTFPTAQHRPSNTSHSSGHQLHPSKNPGQQQKAQGALVGPGGARWTGLRPWAEQLQASTAATKERSRIHPGPYFRLLAEGWIHPQSNTSNHSQDWSPLCYTPRPGCLPGQTDAREEGGGGVFSSWSAETQRDTGL